MKSLEVASACSTLKSDLLTLKLINLELPPP
nr:MAG TPA: hypothetical protein [Caudoviricetes sp.]